VIWPVVFAATALPATNLEQLYSKRLELVDEAVEGGLGFGPAIRNRINHVVSGHIGRAQSDGSRHRVGPKSNEGTVMSKVVQRCIANEQQPMDALVIQAGGVPANGLAISSEPVPQPGPGEVLVEVLAAAVNPLDVANVQAFLGTPLPMIRGR
jgi:hypothetical protein